MRVENLVVVVAFAAGVMLTMTATDAAAWRYAMVWNALAVALIGLGAIMRARASLAARRLLLIAGVALLGIAGIVVAGPKLGPGAALMTAAVFAVFVAGRKATWFAVGLATAVMAGAAALFVVGGWAPPAAMSPGLSLGEQCRIFTSTTMVVTSVGIIGARTFDHIQAMFDERADAMAAQHREEAIRQGAAEALRDTRHHEALGRLAGGVAHDINNGLAVISVNAQIVADDPDSGEEVRELARTMLEACHRAAATTQAVMAMSRPTSSAVEEAELREVLTDIAGVASRVLAAPLRLLADDSPQSVHIKLGPARLQHAILRTLVDGLDAVQGDGVIDAHITTGAEVVLTLSRVVPALTSEKLHGVEQGLHSVRQSLESRRGALRFAHENGALVASLVLPVAAQPDTAATTYPSATKGHKLRVLVVDDERTVRRALSRVLRAEGFDVLTAEDGASATDVFDRERVDLLLTDVVMPNTDTAAMIEAFRRQQPGVPIIVCSGYVDQDQVLQAIGSGQLEFIAKPFQPAELLQRMDRLLTLRGRGSA